MKDHDQLMNEFLDVMRPIRAGSTLKRYQRILIKFLMLFKSLHQIEPEQIINFVHQPKVSRQTQIQYFAVLKHFFEWLVLESHLLFSPMRNLSYPKAEKSLPKKVMSMGEAQRVLNTMPLHTDNHKIYRNRVIMELLYSCSLRRSEVTALELSDFDADTQSLKIKAGKTKKGRLLPVGQRVSELLATYITKFRPATNHNQIFVADKGGPVRSDWVTNLVRNCRKKSQIRTKATSHSFRKSSATHMLRNGANLPSVQALLGHEHIESTEIYTKVYPQDLFRIHRAHHPREKQKNPNLPELEVPTLLFRRK
jgi:integrase/recombinase XerD